MLERVRQSLVKSYVGAIALGMVFAQAISHLTGIFAVPLSSWLSRQSYRGVADNFSTEFRIEEAIPELVRSALLLVIGYLLLRWLYFQPPNKGTAAVDSELQE